MYDSPSHDSSETGVAPSSIFLTLASGLISIVNVVYVLQNERELHTIPYVLILKDN